jgi:Lon protease-like protein
MNLPDEVGIMVLPGLVFFPHNLAPLHIFEPRYREMLAKALQSHRMFGICHGRETGGRTEPCDVGGIGIIRACVQNDDGSSNLILQGVARVRFITFTQAHPYYVGVPLPIETEPGTTTEEEKTLVLKIVELACRQPALEGKARTDVAKFLGELRDVDMLVDIVAGNFIECPERKQELLELDSRSGRLHLLARSLHDQHPNARPSP